MTVVFIAILSYAFAISDKDAIFSFVRKRSLMASSISLPTYAILSESFTTQPSHVKG